MLYIAAAKPLPGICNENAAFSLPYYEAGILRSLRDAP
jgi:hypothetical protein